MERVKFYSTTDLSRGWNLKKSEDIIIDYDLGSKEAKDINDIIELYNIKKFFDSKTYLQEWTPGIVDKFNKIIKETFGIVPRFIKSINDDNFINIYNEIGFDYGEDFWELINNFKAYENISEQKFIELMSSSKVSLYDLLKYKNVTAHFGGIIKDYMVDKSCSSAELLLDYYELNHTDPLYLPKELSNRDKEAIISNYIDCDEPNLNYLRLITNIQSNKDKLEISPKILLKSKRKAEELENYLFEKNTGLRIETAVVFSKSQEEVVTLRVENQSTTATYSSNWIEENVEYATLLNNFIYLFEYVDSQMRCNLVNKNSEMGVLERHLVTRSQNAYSKGFAFDNKNIFSLLQLTGYYNQLFNAGIRLEEVIEWFFREYLLTEFGANNFRVTLPSASSTFLEKCTNIMPALEAVLKQFILYVEEGHIDFELLDIRSEHLIYKNIPSLVNKRYVYGVGEEFNTATFLLFSDQSGLGYFHKTKTSYNNFLKLMNNVELKLIDVPEYNLQKINWLIEHKYIESSKDEIIVFHNKDLILLLYDLYVNDVAVYWKYPTNMRLILENLQSENVVVFENSLFSRPEQAYFNYILNKSQFNNGLDLRNKYSHTQPTFGEDGIIHNQNYYIFLRMFIIAVIKINDDFCIAAELRNLRVN